jgi:hypothetical protein
LPSRLRDHFKSAGWFRSGPSGMVHVSGRATSLMSPGPCHTRSSSFTSLRRSPTALNNQACSLSYCPIQQPARERLAVLRRRRWRFAGAGGHERSRAASRPVHCSRCWMPTCRRDFAIISSLRNGSGQRLSDFAHVPRTVPYTVLLLYFATPLTHCPEQPSLLTFGLPDSATGRRTAGCSAEEALAIRRRGGT